MSGIKTHPFGVDFAAVAYFPNTKYEKEHETNFVAFDFFRTTSRFGSKGWPHPKGALLLNHLM